MPGFVGVADDIFRFFRDAKILLFYRYGPNYVYSLLNLPEWGNREKWTFESALEDCLLNLRFITPEKPDNRVLYLKYEEMIENPSEFSKKIEQFLGTTSSIRLEAWKLPINTIQQEHEFDRWKKLTRKQMEKMRIMNKDLRRLGYPEV